MVTKLFDEEFLRKLRHLELVFRRSLVGRGEGAYAGKHKGGRIEFRDFREYTPGDDFRDIDWNVLARADSLFVKEYAREEQLQLCVLVDTSASMGYGAPSKFDYARRFALAMAYLGLIARNEVRLYAFSDELTVPTQWITDVRQLPRAMEYLEQLTPSGRTSMAPCLRDFYEGNPRRCLLLIVSDLLDMTNSRRALQLLAARGFDLCMFQTLHADELHPPFQGRLRLHDSETGRRRELWFEGEEREAYLRIVNDFREQWREFSARHGMRFFSLTTDVPFEELVLRYLRAGGLVR